jgi:hypothetical protein
MLNLAVLSRRVRSRAWRERGMILTLDALIALLIAAGGVIGIGSALVHVMSGAGHAIQAREVFASLDRAETTLQAKADSAVALLSPPNAIGGGANCSGGKCVTFAAYVNDSAHNPYFWALQATSKRGASAVQPYKCSGTDASGNLSGCAVDGTAIVVPQGFYFRVVPVTALAGDTDTSPTTKAHLAALGITPKRVTFAFEHAGVVASNDVFYLHFGSRDTGDDVLALTARAIPAKGASLVDGHYLPTPPPTIDHGTSGPGVQVFPYPGAAPAGFTVHEYQYHDQFSVATSCVMGGAQVASISPGQAAPNPNPLTPPGQDSGPASFTTSPVSPGVCGAVVTDTYNQTITQSVQVMGPLTIANGALVFTTPSAPAQSDNVSKTYDNNAVQASASGCGGIAAFGVTSQTTPGSVSASPAVTRFNVWPAGGGYGSCTMSVSDQYGEAVPLNVTVWQGLQVSPLSVTFPDSTQPACLYPDNSAHNPCIIGVSKWGYNSPSTYGIDSSQCAVGGTYSEATSSAGTITANGATASTFAISPTHIAQNPCSMIVSDSVGEQASVSVQVDGPPCPSGQPRDANGNCPTGITGNTGSWNWDWVPYTCYDYNASGQCSTTGYGNYWEGGSGASVPFPTSISPDVNHPIVVTTSLNLGPPGSGMTVWVANPANTGILAATWNGSAFIFSSGSGAGTYTVEMSYSQSPSAAPPNTATCTTTGQGKNFQGTCTASYGFDYAISQP